MPLSKCSRSPKIKLLNINSVPILLDKRDKRDKRQINGTLPFVQMQINGDKRDATLCPR